MNRFLISPMMADLMHDMKERITDHEEVIGMLGQDGGDVFERLMAGRVACQNQHAMPDPAWAAMDGVLLAAAMYIAQEGGERFAGGHGVLSPENIGWVTMRYQPVMLTQLSYAIGERKRLAMTGVAFRLIDNLCYIALWTLSLLTAAALMATVQGVGCLALLLPAVGVFITLMCVLTEGYETFLRDRLANGIYSAVYVLCCLWETLCYQLNRIKGGKKDEPLPEPCHP